MSGSGRCQERSHETNTGKARTKGTRRKMRVETTESRRTHRRGMKDEEQGNMSHVRG